MAADPVWLGTSWKMTKTLAEARAFVDEVNRAFDAEPVPDHVRPFVLPAATALAAVRDRLAAGSPVLLGAQNAHWAPDGAGTGEISMRMVKDAGARMVEIGHSERREAFGETDDTVAAKVAAAAAAQLIPLICVGEPAGVRAAGGHLDFVARQVRAAVSRLPASALSQVMLAYEPIWSIGTAGKAADPGQVGPVLDIIAATMADLGAAGFRGLLYGGSVDAGNAADLLALPAADGLFVGRAAWPADGFLRLVRLVQALT